MASGNKKAGRAASNVRDRLLKESANLFMQYGYERTTMRNIANATGIKLGSIAYYFKSKEDILYATMSAVIESGEQTAIATLEGSDDVRQKLQSLIEIELHSLEWRCLSKKHRTLLLRHQKIYENIWSDVLKECHARGIIRAKPEITRRVLRGAFAWSESWNGMERDLSIEELAKEIMQLITHE
jgi:AcrR family transcriptional regulator